MKNLTHRNRARARRGEAGVALVEFALVLPLLMLLLIGGVEIGRYAYFSIIVANAAHAGAQYGSQNGVSARDAAGIQAAAQGDGINGISGLTVTSNPTCACWNGSAYSNIPCTAPLSCNSGHPVELISVTVSGTAHSLFNYHVLPSSLAVSATTTMRLVAQ